jgi:hypothetical protein
LVSPAQIICRSGKGIHEAKDSIQEKAIAQSVNDIKGDILQLRRFLEDNFSQGMASPPAGAAFDYFPHDEEYRSPTMDNIMKRSHHG